MISYMDSLLTAEDIPPSDLQRPLPWFILPLIVALTGLAISISIVCLKLDYFIVFPNLFYLPIIMTSTFYPNRGVLFAVILTVGYCFLVLLFSRDLSLLLPALIRASFFVLIGAIIAGLTKARQTAESILKRQNDNLAQLIAGQIAGIEKKLEETLRQERAYRETVEYHERILAQVSTPILIWNSESYITLVNPAFERLLGRPKSDLVGRKLTSLPGLDEAFRTASPDPIGLDIMHSDGTARRVLWSFSTLTTDELRPSAATLAIGQEVPVGKYQYE